jgi:hypothetical protein
LKWAQNAQFQAQNLTGLLARGKKPEKWCAPASTPCLYAQPADEPWRECLALFAEFEHDILRKRVRAGLAHARQNGNRLGQAADGVPEV